jgi:hypothetical protein
LGCARRIIPATTLPSKVAGSWGRMTRGARRRALWDGMTDTELETYRTWAVEGRDDSGTDCLEAAAGRAAANRPPFEDEDELMHAGGTMANIFRGCGGAPPAARDAVLPPPPSPPSPLRDF